MCIGSALVRGEKHMACSSFDIRMLVSVTL